MEVPEVRSSLRHPQPLAFLRARAARPALQGSRSAAAAPVRRVSGIRSPLRAVHRLRPAHAYRFHHARSLHRSPRRAEHHAIAPMAQAPGGAPTVRTNRAPRAQRLGVHVPHRRRVALDSKLLSLVREAYAVGRQEWSAPVSAPRRRRPARRPAGRRPVARRSSERSTSARDGSS